MQTWLLFKQTLLHMAGLDRDALNILVSLAVALTAAMVTRRPLAHPLPWLLVMAIGFGNEIAPALSEGRIEGQELWPAARDLGLFMAVPTVLMLVGRFAPQLLAARPDRRILIPAIWEKRLPVVDVVFRESDTDSPASKR